MRSKGLGRGKGVISSICQGPKIAESLACLRNIPKTGREGVSRWCRIWSERF